MRHQMMQELARLFDLEARDAVPVRIFNGVVVPPSYSELREQQRLTSIATDIRHRADATRALRIVGG